MRKSISKYIKELSKYLDDSANIVLICHINPDGDAVGSMLGMYHWLRSRKKSVTMISPSQLQEFLKWMPGAGDIVNYENNPGTAIKHLKSADLVILLDFNDTSRIERIWPLIEGSGKSVILIDHHPVPNIKADLVISEPGISSTAELVYELVSQVENRKFNEIDFIESVYVGMMTDTGNFNFGPFDGETLRNVAGMLDSGLRKDYITNHIYNNFSAGRMRLTGFALSERMVVMPHFHTAYIYLSKADLDRYNHVTGDTEGFVNMPLTIDGIIFSVLFIERNDHIKLSLRSRGEFDVNTFASEYFNGGGHRNASGGKSSLEMEDCLGWFESLLPVSAGKLEESYRNGL
ncbi:MAG: bifunctional oligoribonuclease/PAP phosphatase NrnA [Bacteroidia bacterium]|nr:MAG: bifunctional oligoribonuclease/PAP phosphatase NrnA [Bacteroidia bacterium]